MKQNITKSIDFEFHDDFSELTQQQVELIQAADQASRLAYAPYSDFFVGCAVLLEDGTVVKASNKENASFPAGICAERNALNFVSDHHPGQKILKLSVMAKPNQFEMTEPASPCGICRQVIAETEKNQQFPIEIIMASDSGKALIVKNSESLLPFHFYLSQLKK